jgi:hypothetical protein
MHFEEICLDEKHIWIIFNLFLRDRHLQPFIKLLLKQMYKIELRLLFFSLSIFHLKNCFLFSCNKIQSIFFGNYKKHSHLSKSTHPGIKDFQFQFFNNAAAQFQENFSSHHPLPNMTSFPCNILRNTTFRRLKLHYSLAYAVYISLIFLACHHLMLASLCGFSQLQLSDSGGDFADFFVIIWYITSTFLKVRRY